MFKWILPVLLTLCLATLAWAVPTPKATQLLWDDYTDSDAVGYFMYWALEREAAPRVYDNTRRVNVGANPLETITVAVALPTAKGKMCFKLTAYDAALLVPNESAFSNEACGFFGVTDPKNLRTQ